MGIAEMKPFDLEAAKRGKPVVTRDGRKVIDLHHFEHDKSELCLCVHIEGEGSPDWFHANGRDNLSDEDPSDLFMESKKRTVYINIWRDSNQAVFHDDSAQAECAASFNGRRHYHAIAAPVEIED
jgi:hypothetical protein